MSSRLTRRRSNIVGTRKGVALSLRITIVSAACKPIAGAACPHIHVKVHYRADDHVYTRQRGSSSVLKITGLRGAATIGVEAG